MKPPLFIVGCPRSGTTFLGSLLKSSTYGVAFESHFIVKQYKKLSQYGPLDDYQNFSKILAAILQERAVMQRSLELDPEILFSKLVTKDYPSLVNHVCLSIARKGDERVESWGDKTPDYTLDVECLIELFPGSRFIYITRDGRDVALSLLEKLWGPGSVQACAALWKRHIAKKEVLEPLRVQGRALFVKYEDLLVHPRVEIQRLYDFLDERCPVAELEALEAKTRVDNFDKWRTIMTPRQIEAFERVAADALRKEGYETTFDPGRMDFGYEVMSTLAHGMKRARHLLEVNVVDGVLIRFFGKEPFNE